MVRKQPGEKAKVSTTPAKGAGVSSRVEKALSHGDAAARKLAAVLAHTLKARGGNLRRLQKGALEAVQKNLEAGKWDGLVKLPTGAGKTRLFCEISGALGLPTLVLVPRKSLVEQTGEAYRKLQEDGAVSADAHISEVTSDAGTAAGQVRALLAAWDDAGPGRQGIVVTTYQSLTSLAVTDPEAFADLFVRVEAVVSDEAHRSLGRKTREAVAAGLERNGHVTWSTLPATLQKTIRQEVELEEDETLEGDDLRAALRLLADVQDATEALVQLEKSQGRKLHLLFTATPDLIDKSADGVSPYIYRATLADAAQDGDIVLPSLADVGPAKMTLEEGEEIGPRGVREGDLDGWIDRFEVETEDGTTAPVAVAVTEKYLELREACGGRLPAVALCRTIEHAGRVVDLLRSHGIRAERVTSDKGDIKEKAAKARLQDGTLEAVATVTKVSEGWDVPELSAALWYAPTLSPAKNLQANGRIMRAKEGKTRENVFIVEPTSWDVTREYEGSIEPGGEKGPKKPPRKPPTDDPKAPRVTNLPNSVQRMVEMGELTEEQATGLYPGVKIEHLPEATEEKGWLVDILWPDGKTEPGRAVTTTMPDVHGSRGETILRRLNTWRSGTDEQKEWLAANAKDPGAKITGHPVTVVRASVLEEFCHEHCAGNLPFVKADGTVDVLWPDGKTEPGRAITRTMPNIRGVPGQMILRRLEEWEKSAKRDQREWFAANVKDPGAKTDSGKPVIVVRATALDKFCQDSCGYGVQLVNDHGLVDIEWPDGTTAPGQAVTVTMQDIHGAKGYIILRRLGSWEKSGNTQQKDWIKANVKFDWVRGKKGRLVTVVRASSLKNFCQEECSGGLPTTNEEKEWLVNVLWPEGAEEFGRAVTNAMPDVYGAKGYTILRRLETWKSGTDKQKEWFAANVKDPGAKVSGASVVVVRVSALKEFCREHCGADLPIVTEKDKWLTPILWPDGQTEPGRAVKVNMPNIHGIHGHTVLHRIETWKSGTDAQKKWLLENVKEEGAKTDTGRPITVVRASVLKDFIDGKLPCSDPCEANGWTTLLDWPDGEIEPGRAVTCEMLDVHGAKGRTVLDRIELWKSGAAAQKKWIVENVRGEGIKTDAGRRVTVVRTSALPWFIAQIKKQD